MLNENYKITESLFSIMRKRIITGLVLLIPLSLTLWIIIYALNILTGWSVGLIGVVPYFQNLQGELWFDLIIRALSMIFLLSILFCIGQFAKYAVGRRIFAYMENLMVQLPMFKSIYLTIKQILDAIRSTKSGMFRQVVLIEYPRKGIYTLAFLTNYNNNKWEIGEKSGRELVSVFLPTTPNPTGGFLLFIPKEDCVFLDMSVTDGMRLVISGGVISPGDPSHSSTNKIMIA